MTKAARFTKADVKRTVDGIVAAGLSVAGVEVNDNGFIVLVGEAGAIRKRKNPLDRLHGP